MTKRVFLVTMCLLLLLPAPLVSQEASTGKVYVVLWFDTEDYILPASDSATLRLARFLWREGIKAVFKIVGARARSFETRKRDDIIESLKKHEIGYHSQWHSVQPTQAQYLSALGWDEGIAEFDRREKPGVDDIRRIFGVAPTCYGQPGSSWGPQSYGAMKKWGMPVYLDEGSHVRLDRRPFYYGGCLNLYNLEHVMRADLTKLDKLQEAEDRFLAARTKILKEGSGIISIYYHPCEFAHAKFWDGVNFANGANPPKEEWKLPPAKTEEETRLAFEIFERYIRFIKRFPEVQFITASETAELYRDKAQGRSFTPKELQRIAAEVKDEISFQRRGDHCLSASEILLLLNQAFAADQTCCPLDLVTLKGTPAGPSEAGPVLKEPITTDWSQFTRTAADVQDYLAKHGRVPSTVWLGSKGISPETYLVALAKTYVETAGKPAPKEIELRPARLQSGDFVQADNPKLWGWVIFPRDFSAPAMMELAKRQAWTLKPALLKRE